MECNCEKQKKRPSAEKEALIHRLNRMEGQIRGIRTMVETDRYCIDILTQISAATAALHALSRELLATHVRTCVADGIRQGEDDVIEELLNVLQRFIK